MRHSPMEGITHDTAPPLVLRLIAFFFSLDRQDSCQDKSFLYLCTH